MRARWKVTAAAAACAVFGASVGWHQWGPRPAVSPGLRAELTGRVTRFLEQDPRWRTEAAAGPDARPACEAYVFGADPIDVADVDQVRTVYAWVGCRWLPPHGRRLGVGLPELPAVSTPIAVYLGPPTAFAVPGDGKERFAYSIDQLFPRGLRDDARHQPRDFTATTERLDDRVDVLLDRG